MITKGKIRILQQGADYITTRYNYNGNMERITTEDVNKTNPKIDKERGTTFSKVMKKLNKKNITITGITEDDNYTTIHYEVHHA